MTEDKNYIELKAWLDETRDEPLEAMGSFFDLRIGEYEEHMSVWGRHYRWMAELIPPSAGTLLDLGCGSGLELDCIFERLPNLHVTGVDLSGQMLEKLRRKHPSRALTLVQDDYFAFDMGEGCFDAAVSFETLHHFTAEKKTELFRKVLRSLKPGGVYLECDYIATSPEIERLVFDECARRRRRDGIPEDVFVHFDTPLTLEHEMRAMSDAGFGTVELVGFLPGDDHTPMLRAIKDA